MASGIDLAMEKSKKGYTCSQAVSCAYCERFGVDENVVFKMTEGFGTGMANMEGTCGALTGAIVLCGLKNSGGPEGKPGTVGSTYKYVRKVQEAFKEKNSTTICKELKGVQSGKMIRSCAGCIKDACEIVEEVLLND